MAKLCAKCNYLGNAKKWFLDNFFPTFNMFFGIGFIFFAIYGNSFGRRATETPTYVFIHTIIAVAIGIAFIAASLVETKTCPKCGNKEMLPLNDPQALELIKKYDLKPGENPKPDSLPETTPNPK